MCLVKTGKVLEVKEKNAIVLVDGNKKKVRIEGEVRKGDKINIFQNLGFK